MGRKNQKRQTISFEDAMAITPDDLPDGAFFAMAHDIAVFCLTYYLVEKNHPHTLKYKCDKCNRKFRTPEAARIRETPIRSKSWLTIALTHIASISEKSTTMFVRFVGISFQGN